MLVRRILPVGGVLVWVVVVILAVLYHAGEDPSKTPRESVMVWSGYVFCKTKTPGAFQVHTTEKARPSLAMNGNWGNYR